MQPNYRKESYVLRIWESNTPHHTGWHCRLDKVQGRPRVRRTPAVRAPRNFRSNPECSIRITALSALPDALEQCKLALARHLQQRIEDDRLKLASLRTLTADAIPKPP